VYEAALALLGRRITTAVGRVVAREALGRALTVALLAREGAPEVPGKNEDVTINLAYQALLDPTLGYTALTMRFHGVQ